ncbi:MAG: CPBP family intramembrane metalloprotease [Theionarchaea archaeon]|nr:CPBP family intramembrane metalloprotease [Theionarchaea archaeon]
MIRKLASVIVIVLLLSSDCRLLFLPYIMALLALWWVPSPSLKVWRQALVYSLLTIPLFIERPHFSVNFLEIALNVVLGFFLISFYYRDIRVMFSPVVRELFPRINPATFYYRAGFIYSSAVIEEVFFKGFMLQKLVFFGLLSVPIVSLLFVFLHWINPIQMGKREWTVLSTMAVGSGLLFYFTSSIIGCVLCHCIYSTPSVMTLYLQKKHKKKCR